MSELDVIEELNKLNIEVKRHDGTEEVPRIFLYSVMYKDTIKQYCVLPDTVGEILDDLCVMVKESEDYYYNKFTDKSYSRKMLEHMYTEYIQNKNE